jgi:beta-lactamase class D
LTPAWLLLTALVTDQFQKNNVEGTFVVVDLRSGEIRVTDQKVARRGFLPASTFKLPNTLIGLEAGVIPDEHFTLKWDGQERQRSAWNRDQDLTSALRDSVVWYYQEVARRIGAERMRAWLAKLQYGNQKITCGGKTCIDAFWLGGDLRITPLEQVDFLRRLRAGKLPISAEHRDLLLRIFPDQGGYLGKTGTTSGVAWMVGYAGDYAYAFLLLGGEKNPAGIFDLRKRMVETLLREAGAIP